MVKSFLSIFLATFLAVFCLVPHTASAFDASVNSSKQTNSQQSPELVTRDEQGNVTYHLSDAPQTRSDTKPLANPPGYDAIIEDGFPVQTWHTEGMYQGGPAIHTLVGDVNCDGFQEIVVTGLAIGPLYMFDYQGNLVPGWPQPFQGAAYPVMQEGLVITEYFSSEYMTAYNRAGSVLWRGTAGVASAHSIGDVHSLASVGVFTSGTGGYFFGYQVADGTALPGWPTQVDVPQSHCTSAIADIDNDGENEIIFGAVAFNEDGSTVPGWPAQLSKACVNTFPVIGDVDGDGEKEVIIVRRSESYPWYGYVNVYSPAGILKRTWQLSGECSSGTAPALADIDGDDIPEIIVQTDDAIDVTDGFGTPLSVWPLLLGSTRQGSSAPVAGDVDGNGDVEIVFTTQVPGSSRNGHVHIVNHDGTYVTNFPMPLLIGFGAVPAIADIDRDGHNEIIITGQYWYGQAGYYDKVWVFDLDRDNPSAQHGRIEWGQFGNIMRHTNAYKEDQVGQKCFESFCVSNETELQNALTEAQSNRADDVIKVVQGTYNGNFTYSSSERNSITLLGGYVTGCINRRLNPENTVLDGGNSGRVLELICSAGEAITVDGFTIQHGGNVSYGGGVFAQSATAFGTSDMVTITNNIITENSVTESGGGVYAVSESTSGTAGSVIVANNLIYGNAAPNLDGGGVYAASFSPSGTAGTITLTNNTLIENSAQDGGGVFLGVGNAGGAISTYNNIVWGNTATASGDDIFLDKGSGTATSYNNDYSNMSGDLWDSESGKIADDPLFVGAGDYHLQPDSPCIDKGTNSAPELLSTDFEGDPRIMDGNRDGDVIVDIGADERHRLWYVDGDKGASGNGTSWTEAFKTIEEALGAASDGDEIWVKQGIYPLVAQLNVDKVVHMYGGFAGTEIARNQRDWLNNTTTVDGQNVDYRCFYAITDATIDGFTITGGNPPTGIILDNSGSGGGIACFDNSSPIITNCIISGNVASFGGGIACTGNSSPTITNCTFAGNSATFGGRGIDIIDSFPIITNCTFSDGETISNVRSVPTITNCTFTGSPTSSSNGRAISNVESFPTVTNCTFVGNTANGNGGAIYNDYSFPTITNCIFTGNTSNGDDGGGAIYNYVSSPIITNCTFVGNTANAAGGAIYNGYDSNTKIINCILWGDSASTGGAEIYNVSSALPTVTYSDVQGGYTGTGNIDANPFFVDVSDPDPINWDLHLRPISPCIDTGTNAAPALPAIDFEGDDRIIDGDNDDTATADMGADEYDGSSYNGYAPPCDYDADGQTDIGVYRPSNGAWYLKRSTLGSQTVYWGGNANDVPTPENYGGDGATDLTVYRSSNGWWYIKGVGSYLYGAAGDIPIPGDYDGDGAIDLGVYRPSTGWWYVKDVGNYLFGGLADDIPVPGDYDGDGTSDIALFRPSTGWWYIKGVGNCLYGQSDDIPVPGDYDGDGITDIALFRPSTGWWYIKDVGFYLHGAAGDIPVPGDYDGDGTTDIAVFRPSNGRWYIKDASTFPIWGQSGDIPLTRNVWIWQETGLLP